jgi:hypothetical protein
MENNGVLDFLRYIVRKNVKTASQHTSCLLKDFKHIASRSQKPATGSYLEKQITALANHDPGVRCFGRVIGRPCVPFRETSLPDKD